jgi:hypothetical protein
MSAVSEATTHLHPLISDLGLILMTAGIAVLIFKKSNNLWCWAIYCRFWRATILIFSHR